MFTLDQAGRRRGEVEVCPPPPGLRPWVEHLVLDGRPAAEDGPWRIVPDPSGHVVVTFGRGGSTDPPATGPLLGARIVGARTRWVDADVTRRGLTLGVRFRPGGLAALLGESGHRLTDRGVDLGEALGAPGREALDRLQDARTAAEALSTLGEVLGRVASRRPEPDWRIGALERALAAGRGGQGPGGLATATGMAPRTLRAVTAENVGMAPGRWIRIHRLFRALQAQEATPAPSWRWIAARVGYHDPSHLTREFRALLGETPTAWAGRASR